MGEEASHREMPHAESTSFVDNDQHSGTKQAKGYRGQCPGVRGKLCATGFQRSGSEDWFAWPIWRERVPLSTLRALLGQPLDSSASGGVSQSHSGAPAPILVVRTVTIAYSETLSSYFLF